MASSRFPGKPLVPIEGLPMVLHVYERALRSDALARVLIATCDEEIATAARHHGAEVSMTSSLHQRGTDRVAEAAQDTDADVIVNIQGDEPLLEPAMIDQVVAPLAEDEKLLTTNLIQRMGTDETADPDQVKTVLDLHSNVLYFSREPIPWRGAADGAAPAYRQLGVVAFRREFLLEYAQMELT
jgi:3-deoxy-manno-octulosonate cytidylyltransferase (CMP-KDO synthetase)